MLLTTATVELPGAMSGYLAHPAAVHQPLPGVIVIQEIWGVDAHIRDVTDRFAAAGYTALAPDLFSRGGGRPRELTPPRMDAAKAFVETLPPGGLASVMDPSTREGVLAKLPERERAAVGETVAALFSPDRFALMPTYAQDLVAIAGWLRAQPSVGGKRVGAVGFCMGGGLAGALAADDPKLAAAAIYYGQPPGADAIAKIGCPILAVFGKQDARLVGQLPAFEQAMTAAGKPLELHVYDGAGHAFFNDTRHGYHADAARDAWARTLALFAKALA